MYCDVTNHGTQAQLPIKGRRREKDEEEAVSIAYDRHLCRTGTIFLKTTVFIFIK